MPKIVLDLDDRYVLDDGSVVLRRKALLSCIRNGVPTGSLTGEKIREVERHNKLSKADKRIKIAIADDQPGVMPAWRYEWPTPEPWKTLDLPQKCIDRLTHLGLTSDKYYIRLAQELAEIDDREMEGFIRHVGYICADMEARQVVRGVGRGSSCASLVLFLLGVHFVDPVLYSIPITEFFKPVNMADDDDAVPAEEIGS